MKDIKLKSMSKTQLLNIMREQEIEIQKLYVDRDEILTKHRIELEKLTAEKDELEKNQGSASAFPEDSDLIAKYQVEFEKLIDEKNELAKKFYDRELDIHRLTAEKEESERKRQSEVETLSAEKEEFAIKRRSEIEMFSAEKEELIKRHRGEIERLDSEKEELIKKHRGEIERFEKIIAEKDETRRVNFENIENAGSLAEAAVAASGLVKAAQEAADIYLNNIKFMETTKSEAAKKLEDEARERADAMIKAAEAKREEVEREEKKSLENLKNASEQYMGLVAQAQLALSEMTQQYNKLRLPNIIINELNEKTAANEPKKNEQMQQPRQPQQSRLNDELSFKTGNRVKYEYVGNIAKYQHQPATVG